MQVTTDHAEITAALDAALARDPVRGTVLGTMRSALDASAWAALGPDGVLAVRSESRYHAAVLATAPGLAGALAGVADLAGLSGPVDLVDGLCRELDRPVAARVPTALYRLDNLTIPGDVAGSGARAGRDERDLLVDWIVAFLGDVEHGGGDPATEVDAALAGGGLYVWHDSSGAPVSMARRRAVHAGSARIGPVYTPPRQRGHGYGSAVTAAASASILAEGAVPVLFTETSNATSNKIYRALGYTLVENRVMIRFS